MPQPAPIALFALAGVFLLFGIIFMAIAGGVARGYAVEVEDALMASRSRFQITQMSDSLACTGDADGCDYSCNPFRLDTTVPAYAFFHFYNITNDVEVNTGTAAPNLKEVGPFTCVSAPPYSEARISQSSVASSTADTTAPFDTLECAAVSMPATIKTDHISLYDKTQDAVITQPVGAWINALKPKILNGGGLIGVGGSRAFGGHAEHGNVSNPNNYMRRIADDAPVLPIFPHAYLPEGEWNLQPAITEKSVLQWYVASIGQTISFTYLHPLYLSDQSWGRFLYARFLGDMGTASFDLTARGSHIFDHAYSYHKCAAAGKTSSVEIDATGYPLCSPAEGVPGTTGYPDMTQGDDGLWSQIADPKPAKSAKKMMIEEHADDFFIDINLMLGIPSGLKDANSAGGFQAWNTAPWTGMASPNCTANVGEWNMSPNLWAWGFWSGSMPYVSHGTKSPYANAFDSTTYPVKQAMIDAGTWSTGYNPWIDAGYSGGQGKFLAEFAVQRTGHSGVVPAFAFSMMPKMTPLLSPTAVGKNFPSKFMGKVWDPKYIPGANPPLGDRTPYNILMGDGFLWYMIYFANAVHIMWMYMGIYFLVYAFVPIAAYGAYRFKADAASA